mgnify:CR=1 FL=1
MRVDMDEIGVLTIRPDTPTEAYALKKWCDECINGNVVKTDKLIIFSEIDKLVKIGG